MSESLATSFGKLAFGGRGNGVEDALKVPKQPEANDERPAEGVGEPEGNKAEQVEGAEPQAVKTWNLMVDLFVAQHFANQAAARRYLQNLMYLGSRVMNYCTSMEPCMGLASGMDGVIEVINGVSYGYQWKING